ncbi:MAG: DUF898 family protein [Tidjanibacter sp.]|nr:DUF898 family protein [Tidjanibacter sp.]
MKNYFNFTIKAKQFVPYVFGMILLIVAGVTIDIVYGGATKSPMAVIDGGFLTTWLVSTLISMVMVAGIMALYFPVIVNLLSSIVYKDQKIEVECDFRAWMRLSLKGLLLSFITFGIYAPWWVASMLRFFADGSSHGYNRIAFRGKGGRFFAITVLGFLLPMALCSALFSVGTIGAAADDGGFALLAILIGALVMIVTGTFYQFYLYKWYVNIEYGSQRVVLGCKPGALFWTMIGEGILAVITFGIYAPMAFLRIYRAVAREIVAGREKIEARGGLSLTPWKDWAYCWGQILLSIVTIGIYSPWAVMKLVRRFGSRFYFKTIDRPTETMPE